MAAIKKRSPTSTRFISMGEPEMMDDSDIAKKKYLGVNNHIAKINSSLGIRVEELSAEISALRVENLKLRSSGMSLRSQQTELLDQLKKERQRSQILFSLSETAATKLLRDLEGLRVPVQDPPPKLRSTTALRPEPYPFTLNLPSLRHSPGETKAAGKPIVARVFEEEADYSSKLEGVDIQHRHSTFSIPTDSLSAHHVFAISTVEQDKLTGEVGDQDITAPSGMLQSTEFPGTSSHLSIISELDSILPFTLLLSSSTGSPPFRRNR
ncbi:hypothetical protein JAAARDRAFT_637581 [Jaapia argillacea MUCL 33604]|uniref:Shugoshin N-terminal coiled-coil domain-containing protein n=1 Tax=Jaapia argillacea MUCL 33604 TaxID=933084 RepID=A0A067Q8Z5_9AGAM|nr:hypothetical protein JAAARDRAFT_637581 [Jaapia argillacea MUCL 33604]